MLSPAIASGGAASTAASSAVAVLPFPRLVVSVLLPTLSPRPRVSLRPPPHRQQVSVRALPKRNPKRLKYSSPRFVKKWEEMVYVEMDPLGTETWRLEPVIELIKEGAVGVIPTDTVYAIVCNLNSPSSIERLRRIKDIKNSKPLSILCRSFQDIDTYTMGFPRGDGRGQLNIYRVVKHCFPGPYTFVLTARKDLPKQCITSGPTRKYASRKHVGVRMPNDPICQAILHNLDAPLACTSVKWPSEDQWMLDPAVIADTYGPEGLDFIVDGGVRVADPSTVVDMTGNFPTIIRQGKGPKLDWMIAEGEDSDTLHDMTSLQAA